MFFNVKFGNNIFDAEWQKKTFDGETKAVEWVQRNHSKIWIINSRQTLGQDISHFEIIDAIRSEPI